MYDLRYQNKTERYRVDFERIVDNVVQVVGDFPILPDGFYLSRPDRSDNWDYTDYSTCYRKIKGGVQFSNDGTVYIEPTHDVIVSAEFEDVDKQPVVVVVYKNGKELETITLDRENGFKHVYKDEPIKDTFEVFADDIEGADKVINGTTITYSLPAPYEPTIDEQIAEMYDAIIDIDERLSAIEES